MINPTISPGILMSPVEEGYVAYDPALDRLHQLNPLAALLLELCDGVHSVDDIRMLAAPLMPDGQVEKIDKWILEGIEAGLLSSREGKTEGAREFSAAELFAFTKRLKSDGKIRAAYLCGKRTVELKPDHWDAWYDLGEIAQCLGRREEARIAYQRYFDVNPNDGEIEHLLIALRDDTPPPRAADRAIQHIYKNFAASYETVMRDALGYVGPEQMRDVITVALGDRAGLAILDLGCGSGLAGTIVKKRAAKLIGVDLSPEMLELARARNIYDCLEVAEITAWLDKGESLFDLIISCDCLIYFGDLSRIVATAGRRLKPRGYFAISMEHGNRYPYHLTDTGRYTHHSDHVREVSAKAGLSVVHMNVGFLRMEYGDRVMGLYAVLGKADWVA